MYNKYTKYDCDDDYSEKMRWGRGCLPLPALSGISGNSQEKSILQTTKQLMQFSILDNQFWSLIYTTVIGIRKNLSTSHSYPSDS